MNIRILISLIFLIQLSVLKADLGAPTIQGVCKVTLKSGRTIEGIISFGSGGFDYQYRPNGFCIIDENGTKTLKLYNFSFRTFTTNSYESLNNNNAVLYYAANTNLQRNPESSYQYNPKERLLTKITTKKEGYRLLDEMILYKNIPLDLYVRPNKKNDSQLFTIKVSQIKSVQLLEQPSIHWIDLIESARNNLKEAQENEAWEDYMEPVWYHEIIKDKNKVNYLKQFFK